MHKLTVTLKQHTPLIHFQHDQEGATLRASEVKPKLDRFILTKLGNGKYEDGIEVAKTKGWLLGKGDHPALDYKMRIVANERPEEYLIASLLPPQARESSIKILNETPYFAQESVNVSKNSQDAPIFLKEGKGRDANYIFSVDNWDAIDKKGLMWKEIELTIFSLENELLSLIDKFLSFFFICTNFGSRSSKGFGSFTRETNNIEDALKDTFRFAYSKTIGNGDLRRMFKTIKDDYQKIKSGINFNEYTKSILFCYAVEKMEGNPRWEKRFFKKAINSTLDKSTKLTDKQHDPIYDSKGNEDWNDPQNFNYRYLRSMLGVAEQFEFLVDRQTDNNLWKTDLAKKAVVKLSVSDIERYESPILIKVIDSTIYLVGTDVDGRVLGKNVSLQYKDGNRNLNVKDAYKQIRTPDSFDLVDFMNYAMSERFQLGYTKIK